MKEKADYSSIMRMLIFLLLLNLMWFGCEKHHRKFHQQPLNWKLRSFEGKIGYEIKDTTIVYEEIPSTCPLINQKLFK